jgi:hypothetical protein
MWLFLAISLCLPGQYSSNNSASMPAAPYVLASAPSQRMMFGWFSRLNSSSSMRAMFAASRDCKECKDQCVSPAKQHAPFDAITCLRNGPLEHQRAVRRMVLHNADEAEAACVNVQISTHA